MLLECPALADFRKESSLLVAGCSGIMARLLWAMEQLEQHMLSKHIIECLDRCHADDKQMVPVFHQLGLVGFQEFVNF